MSVSKICNGILDTPLAWRNNQFYGKLKTQIPNSLVTPKLNLFPVRLLRAVALGMGSAWSLAAGTFNDANWSALGSGMNNTVYALAVSGTNVYAGGNFSSAVAR